MKISIHESAVKEFDVAIEWYEIQSEGLGKRFKRSVMEQIAVFFGLRVSHRPVYRLLCISCRPDTITDLI